MVTMMQHKPSWFTREDESAWERVKEAFRRDWRQTKHDFGGNEPNLNQQVGDTISQATGSKPIPSKYTPTPKATDEPQDMYDEHDEDAYRYGYAAFRHHGATCEWNAETESKLGNEWGDATDWPQHRQAVKRGWFFAKNQSSHCGNC